MTAQDFMKKLSLKKIGTRPFFWPMHEQPVFKKMGLFKGEKFPVAEALARKGFYIPSGLGLSKNQMKSVVDAIYEIIERN